MPAEATSIPRARVLIVDGDPPVRTLAEKGYAATVMHTYPDLVRALEELHSGADVYLLQHMVNGIDAGDIVADIRHHDPHAGILVYTPEGETALANGTPVPAGSSAIDAIRGRVLGAGADMFLSNFGFLDPAQVVNTMDLLVARKRAKLLSQWDRRWRDLSAAVATMEGWAQAADRVMAWHRADGYSRGRFFTYRPLQDQYECQCSFGHESGEGFSHVFEHADLVPILEVILHEGVSCWDRERLRTAYNKHNLEIPTALRRLYFEGRPFPWIYVSLVHGRQLLANIALDRCNALDVRLTRLNCDSLELFSQKIPDVLRNLKEEDAVPLPLGDPVMRAGRAEQPFDPDAIVQEDSTFRRVLREARTIASQPYPVLITGETGVGKEIVARLIHHDSQLKNRKFLAVNCAAMVSSLTNELFGSIRGAFTGATDRIGYFEGVEGGTLFLDEIGDLDPEIQGRILRVLETGEIVRVGDNEPRKVRFRLVCATNHDLAALIRSGDFRSDLYFRIAGHCLAIPPLRERPADLRAFIQRVLRRYRVATGVSIALEPAATDTLMEYGWPGNVRQVLSVMRSSLAMIGDHRRIGPEDLPASLMPQLDRPGAARIAERGTPTEQRQRRATAGEETGGAAIFQQLTTGEGTFWEIVREPFKARTITRVEVRQIIELGLERTLGSYKQMAILFGIDPDCEYKRFMDFLRTHDLRLDFRPFRYRLRRNPPSRSHPAGPPPAPPPVL